MRCALCPKRAVHEHHWLAQQPIKREFPNGAYRLSPGPVQWKPVPRRPVGDLRALGAVGQLMPLRGLLEDRRNLLPLCVDCHLAHENWSAHGAARLTREQVPGSAWEFARELGEWAVVRLERDYPVRDDDARSAAAHGA